MLLPLSPHTSLYIPPISPYISPYVSPYISPGGFPMLVLLRLTPLTVCASSAFLG